MWKRFLRKKSRQISLLAAAAAGFGLGVNSLVLGAVAIAVAIVLDFVYCGLGRDVDDDV